MLLRSPPVLWHRVAWHQWHHAAFILLAGTSPFSAPRAKRAEADAARNQLRLAASDHITLIRTFELWHAAKANGREKAFCAEHWVSSRVMREVDKARSLFLKVLVNLNFHDGNEHGIANANRTSVPALQVRCHPDVLSRAYLLFAGNAMRWSLSKRGRGVSSAHSRALSSCLVRSKPQNRSITTRKVVQSPQLLRWPCPHFIH